MASLIDPTAQFDQRCRDINLSPVTCTAMRVAGITSLGILAYSHGQPGQAVVDADFTTWVQGTIGAGISLADTAGIKRLLFEAHTLVLASLKEQVTSPDALLTKKVPSTEREAKMRVVRANLTGLVIEGASEPGHALLDSAAQMYHANEVKYLAPERCISRLHEVTHQKQPTRQLELEADKLVVKQKDDEPHESAHSALQVKSALERRGVALYFADMITHTAYTRYIAALFNHLHRDPPPGYTRCSVSQLVNADKLVWAKLLEDNIKPRRDAAGDLALDTELIRALESYQVSFALLPLPVTTKKPSGKGTGGDKTKVYDDHFDKIQRKGKGKGKGKKSSQKVPYGITQLGGVGRTPDNQNICFRYNLEGCKEAADGASCVKGQHVCAKCFGPHPIKEHPKS